MAEKGVFQTLVEAQPFTNLKQLREQRRSLIRQIQDIRKRPLVAYLTSLNPLPRVTAYLSHEDIVPFGEILSSVEGPNVDVMLESPGGLSELAVELFTLLRNRFDNVAFIIPHSAMSAATILVMSGDDILMDHRSSLGAIDPQFVGNDGRPQPAQAVLTGIETIKRLVDENKGVLHPVYIPILRNIDPGKLQTALDASQLSTRIVTEWLTKYKFRGWTTHRHTGQPVTDEERATAAAKVAKTLCSHEKWLSHSHPIKIRELREMGLRITDYGETPELQKAIWSLWVHYHHFLSSTNTYKVYESETIEFYKIAVPVVENFVSPSGPIPPPVTRPPGGIVQPGHAIVEVGCDKCSSRYKLQANFGQPQPLEAGAEPFPRDSVLTCKACGTIIDLTGLKMQLEARIRQPLVFEVIT